MPANARSTWRPLQPGGARQDCPSCGGTGWRLEASAGGSLARRYDCRLLCRSVRLKEDIRIPARYEHCALDAYVPQTLSQHRALRVVRRFVDCYPHVPGGLFIAGPPGVGKTHLAVGILLELAARYREGLLFADFAAMLEAEAYRKTSRDDQEGRRPGDAELLVMDDFGRAPVTDANLEYVEWLLQSRWNARKLTVVTGSLPAGRARSPGQTAELGVVPGAFLRALATPIRMRLIGDSRLLLIAGEDFRRERSGTDRRLLEAADAAKVA